MENLTHTLFGAVLYRGYFERRAPDTLALWLIGANLPDLDTISAFWGSTAYLEHHRGISHSILGVLLQAPLLALFFYLWLRWRRRPLTYPKLLVSATIALVTHPALDLLNNYGIRPWLPFDSSWYYGDLVFIVDPWIWLILGGTLVLTSQGGLRANLLYGLLAVSTSALVLLSPQPPTIAKLLWIAGILFIVLLKRWLPLHQQVYTASMLVFLGYLIGLFGLQQHALSRAAQEIIPQASEPVWSFSVSPAPANPFKWEVYGESAGFFYYSSVTLLGASEPLNSIPVLRLHPAVLAASKTPQGTAALNFCRYPIIEVDSSDGNRVWIRDGRYARTSRRGFSSVSIDVPQ